MKKFFSEFKEFAVRGNVIDMAVGVMIGAAFGKIVASIVEDIFMPLISLLVGNVDFNSMFVSMDGVKYATIDAAKEAGAATLNYGTFISTIIDFILVAFFIFLFVRMINKLKKKEEPAAEPRLCPYCFGEVDERATRCPHCASDISEGAVEPEAE